MTDDPNKKQNEGNYSEQSGQSQNQPNQQNKNNKEENPQRRPSQGGHDTDRDQDQEDKGGQRKAS